MSRTWYPIIKYENCIGCLSCMEFCPHEVFEEKDVKKAHAIIMQYHISENRRIKNG